MAHDSQTSAAQVKGPQPTSAGAAGSGGSVVPPNLHFEELDQVDDVLGRETPMWGSASDGATNPGSGSGGVFFSPSPLINVTPGTFPLMVQVPLSAVKKTSPPLPRPPNSGGPANAFGQAPFSPMRRPVSIDHDKGVATHQIDVPHTATVGDVRWRIEAETGLSGVKLKFDDRDLEQDSARLSQFNIPSAYDAAGSLLWVIEEANLSPQDKGDALEPALAVVNGVRRGSTSFEELAEMAVKGAAGCGENGNGAPPHSAGRSGEPGNPDYSGLLSRLGQKLPHLYTRDAVTALNTAIRTPGPPLPPPSALARLEAWGEPQPKTGGADIKEEVVPSGDGSGGDRGPQRQRTGTWLKELAAEWEHRGTAQKGDARVKEDNDEGDEDEEDEDGDDDDGDGRSERRAGSESVGGGNTDTETGATSSVHTTMHHTSAGGDRPFDGRSSSRHGSHHRDGSTGLDVNAGDLKVPKKRGRKRKNPQLTDAQRMEERKMQNRASAKKSREKKKVQTVEHVQRIETILHENQNLKAELEHLGKRLDLMQQLLTVQVMPKDS